METSCAIHVLKDFDARAAMSNEFSASDEAIFFSEVPWFANLCFTPCPKMVADSEICLKWHGGRTRTVGEKWQKSCVLQGLPLKITLQRCQLTP